MQGRPRGEPRDADGPLPLDRPYVVRRRPKTTFGARRTFIRISLVPVEIEDDRNAHDSVLPRPRFGRFDIRDVL